MVNKGLLASGAFYQVAREEMIWYFLVSSLRSFCWVFDYIAVFSLMIETVLVVCLCVFWENVSLDLNISDFLLALDGCEVNIAKVGNSR